MNIYAIDASALIDGWNRYYPPDVMRTLWNNLDQLINQDRIISTEEVKLELERGNDGLYKWVCDRNKMFRVTTEGVQEKVGIIVNKYPEFVPTRAKDGVWADPYLIALAMLEKRIVVSGEKKELNPGAKPKIPNICEGLDIECISFLQLIRKEGWKY